MRLKSNHRDNTQRRITLLVIALEVWAIIVALYVLLIAKSSFTWTLVLRLGASFLLPLLLWFVLRWQNRLRKRREHFSVERKEQENH